MKQHITPKQLNELSSVSEKKLKKWYDNAYGITLYGNCFPSNELTNPLLSIGQMIEFLHEHFDEVDKGLWVRNINGCFWEVNKGATLRCIASKRELCDALWEVVKEVLEE